MKVIKHLLAIALIGFAATASAQDDDWQIGGGGGSTQTYQGKVTRSSYGRYNNPTTLFNGGHEDAPYGLVIGYVNKTWNTDFGNYVWKENIWGQEGKRLHGLQIGLQYNPCLKMGLGIKTGLYYEAYFSEAAPVKESGWDSFTESNIYIPAHLSYRFPFTRNISASVYGGIGFQWAMAAEYSQYRYHDYYDYYGYGYNYGYGYSPSEYVRYGEGWPKRVNWQAELGINLRLSSFQVGFTYSRGLTNHEFYEEAKTRQNKIAINIGYVFGDF